MKREIGGYLELEEFFGNEYYPNLHHLNLGRTALLWLLEARSCKKILLPYFLCDSVIDACTDQQISIEFYSLDENLNPVLSRPNGLENEEYLYLVNYYGQLTDSRILEYKKTYDHIIVDHTHAFFQRPLPGIDTLYSCRKFFGLSDGAYLSTDATLAKDLMVDNSDQRMAHILGRYEHDASSFYQTMLANASTYKKMNVRSMSKLTRNLLRAIDYEQVKKRRNANYEVLQTLLPSKNPFTQTIPDGPFAYPFYCKNGITLRKQLAKENIFVPTNWSNVVQSMPKESFEYQWAANILPLPCDQRYTTEDMEYMCSVIQSLLSN